MSRPQDVEIRLRELSGDAAWPPTPDLRDAVTGRIAGLPAAGTQRRAPAAAWPRPRRLAVALLLSAAMLLVVAGIAAALGLGVPGLDILWSEPSLGPGSGLVPVVELELVPGSPVPLDEARATGQPRILVPAALPEPGTAFVDGSGTERVVTLAWRALPGTSRIDGSELGLVLMAARGSIETPLLTKIVRAGTSVEPVTVGGEPAWWISGAPHELLVLGAHGGARVLRARYAGDTLVFARDGSVYRLESTLGRDRTVAIAESLR